MTQVEKGDMDYGRDEGPNIPTPHQKKSQTTQTGEKEEEYFDADKAMGPNDRPCVIPGVPTNKTDQVHEIANQLISTNWD